MSKAFCPYCGCGCTLVEEVDSNTASVEKYLPDTHDVVSQGKPCVKGLTVAEATHTNRILTPMMRKHKQDELKSCSWKDAYSFIRRRLGEIEKHSEKHIRDRVYFIGSGEATNESNFLLNKFCRSHFSSNNVDSCARLCHAATTVAFRNVFGLSAIPSYTMSDTERSDLFLFVGTDPMEDYPVMFNRVLQAKRDGAMLVTIDVASNSTTEQADHAFQVAPGGILPLLSHLIIMLVDGGDHSRDTRQFEGFEAFVATAREISSGNPPSTFGFSREDMDKLYQSLNAAKRPTIGFGMGLTQHKNGTQHVYAIAGLSLLLNATLFPNRGKVNIQGAGDMGAEPGWRPNLDAAREAGWNTDFEGHRGQASTEALYDDEIEFVWIMASNPSQSMPDLNALDESLSKKFVVYQHHHPGRTMQFADVVLPTMMLSEEFGSITNGERRVRGIFSSAVDGGNSPMGRKISIGEEIKPNVQVIAEMANELKAKGFVYDSPLVICQEICKVTPDYSNLSHEIIAGPEGGFARKEPYFKKFIPFNYDRDHFQSSGFPFVFTTARERFQFCTGEATRCSKTLRELSGNAYVYMNPDDAHVLQISDGGDVRLVSEVGEITSPVKLNAKIKKRVVVAPFHYEKLLVNRLTPRYLDDESKTPCYKEVGVRVERV